MNTTSNLFMAQVGTEKNNKQGGTEKPSWRRGTCFCEKKNFFLKVFVLTGCHYFNGPWEWFSGQRTKTQNINRLCYIPRLSLNKTSTVIYLFIKCI